MILSIMEEVHLVRLSFIEIAPKTSQDTNNSASSICEWEKVLCRTSTDLKNLQENLEKVKNKKKNQKWEHKTQIFNIITLQKDWKANLNLDKTRIKVILLTTILTRFTFS